MWGIADEYLFNNVGKQQEDRPFKVYNDGKFIFGFKTEKDAQSYIKEMEEKGIFGYYYKKVI